MRATHRDPPHAHLLTLLRVPCTAMRSVHTDCSSSSRLHFAAYVLLSPTAQDAPQTTPRRHIPEAKRLGDFSLPLNYCLDRLREGKPVVEKLTLLRRPVPEEEVPVGRLTVRLRLLTPELSHSLHSVFVMARAAMNLPLRCAPSPPCLRAAT